jgi:segregation and condensation protein B
MTPDERRRVLEALLFSSDVPLTFTRVKELIGEISVEDFAADVAQLEQFYQESERAFGISRAAGGIQLNSRPEYSPWVRRLLKDRLRTRLSRSSLETLAIIAYRQPIARAEIERIRGVDSEGVLGTLMERGLVTVGGRATTVGRPLLYVTTQDFLRHFGLNSLDDLPKLRELQGLVEGDPQQVQMAFESDAPEPLADSSPMEMPQIQTEELS